MKHLQMNKAHLVLYLAIVVLTSSCIVVSPSNTIPLITKKNEGRLEGGITLHPGLTGSFTYSPINHLAAQASGSYFPSTNYYHGALGWYNKTKYGIIVENYFGLGNGYSEGYDNSMNRAKIRYHLYFSQFNVGKQLNSKVLVGFGLKGGYLDSRLYYYNTFNNTYNSAMVIPQWFVRFGEDRLKFDLKLNGCWINDLKMKSDTDNQQVPYTVLNFSFSVNYTFD